MVRRGPSCLCENAFSLLPQAAPPTIHLRFAMAISLVLPTPLKLGQIFSFRSTPLGVTVFFRLTRLRMDDSLTALRVSACSTLPAQNLPVAQFRLLVSLALETETQPAEHAFTLPEPFPPLDSLRPVALTCKLVRALSLPSPPRGLRFPPPL